MAPPPPPPSAAPALDPRPIHKQPGLVVPKVAGATGEGEKASGLSSLAAAPFQLSESPRTASKTRSESPDVTWLTYPSDPYIHTDKNGVAWLMPSATPGMYVDKKGVAWMTYDPPTSRRNSPKRQLPETPAQPQVQFRNPRGAKKPRPTPIILD
jgi:hypothetical protein